MSIALNANFDSGNINVLDAQSADNIRLAIRADHMSDFYQWFHFRLTGAADQPCTLHITNCAGSAYPDGWAGYQACVSEDRQTWIRADTSYADGTLTIHYRPRTNNVWFAYFAPYSMERHHDLIARIAQFPGVSYEALGLTLDGQSIDMLKLGTGPRVIWLYARQHPGETMAQWWMEGVLARLVDPEDSLAHLLRAKASFYIVPNMCPDGSRRGHLRTNAAGVNLNREWAAPTPQRSPEVYYVLARMQQTGVDLALDVHGDESLPHNFIAGFEGIPNISDRQRDLLARYKDKLARITPDFQTKIGYPVSPPGKANLSMSTNQLANRFGCLAMTLEMPFKDVLENPDPIEGWSPDRSALLGRHCLEAILEVIDDLR